VDTIKSFDKSNKKPSFEIMDGNEAAAYIAYKCNEVIAIDTVTPSSTMKELANEWSVKGVKNIFGKVPQLIEKEIEAGPLATTFTASKGLLLKIPEMYKIAAELTPTVFHVASNSLASHSADYGDHSDVMAVCSSGFAMLFGNTPQEVMDMALIAQASTLKAKVPFLNIFDGFRTAHELNEVEMIPDETIEEMIDMEAIQLFQNKLLKQKKSTIADKDEEADLTPVYNEDANYLFQNVPHIVQDTMNEFYNLTGRRYHLYEYYGHAHPDRLIIILGSGAGAVKEAVDYMNNEYHKHVGMLVVRLFRPLDIQAFINAIPKSVVSIAVLDRCKEPNGIGDPLYMNVVNAFNEAQENHHAHIMAGRYGLSSKEFTPAMVKAVFKEMKKDKPKNHFSVGIDEDITHAILDYEKHFSLEKHHLFHGLFFGTNSDGSFNAIKNSMKIISEKTNEHVQGYFVRESKEADALTISHLRFSKKPIYSNYLIHSANFIACHQFHFLNHYDVLKDVEEGAVFLLNAPYKKDDVWKMLPKKIQDTIVHKKLRFYIIHADALTKAAGVENQISAILQTCFFAISDVLQTDDAIKKIKETVFDNYWKQGEAVVQQHYEVVDKTLDNLFETDYSKYLIGGNPVAEHVS
jgi:pyruvate-ferredoxin/flavodoxin oxidoreductase